MAIYCHIWPCMGHTCQYMVIYDNIWPYMAIYVHIWSYISIYGLCMDIYKAMYAIWLHMTTFEVSPADAPPIQMRRIHVWCAYEYVHIEASAAEGPFSVYKKHVSDKFSQNSQGHIWAYIVIYDHICSYIAQPNRRHGLGPVHRQFL